MNDTFAKFGFSFQAKLLGLFITDRDFAKQIVDSLAPRYFESDSLRWIVEKTVDYFKEYKLQPTLDVYKVQISNLQDASLLKTEVVSSLKEVFKSIGSDDKEFIKSQVVTFLRRQNLTHAIENNLHLVQTGQVEEFAKLIQDASKKVELEHNLGHNYLEDVDYRYSEQGEVKRIPTGWKLIDELMGGGMPIGNYGFWMGDQGSGKSFSLVHLGAEALKLGYDVVHWTFELNENYVAYRYDAKLSGIALDNLKYNIADVKKSISRYPGRLIIKEFPAGTVGMNALRSHRDKLHSQGIRPQLFIHDYLDLMKLGSRKEHRADELLQGVHREFRAFCKESEAAGWTASQGTRANSNQSFGKAENLAGAYAKGAEADFWGIIGRSQKDKLSNSAIFNIIKNRFGPDGMHFPAKFDTSKSLIEIFNEKTETGKKVKKEIVNQEQLENQYAAEQFKNLMNSQRKDVNLF